MQTATKSNKKISKTKLMEESSTTKAKAAKLLARNCTPPPPLPPLLPFYFIPFILQHTNCFGVDGDDGSGGLAGGKNKCLIRETGPTEEWW